MVRFNEARITQDGNYLIIDVEIIDEPYYLGVFIESIIIDNHDTYIDNGPSSTPIYRYDTELGVSYVYGIRDCDNCEPVRVLESDLLPYCFVDNETSRKRIRLFLTKEELNVSLDGLFFVYVITTGKPTEDAPCIELIPIMITVFNIYPFFKNSIWFLKELLEECELPVNFINLLLRLAGIDAAIRTGHYIEAIKIWNKFFRGKYKDNRKVIKTCGGCRYDKS